MIRRYLTHIAAAAIVGMGSLAATAHEDLPIFDAHVHYKQPAWDAFPVSTVVQLFDKAGVAMALVSSTPDEGTIRLWAYAPRRVVPELRPYYGEWGSGNWQNAPGMAAYLEDRLDRYPHKGIGEFHVHVMDTANRPLLAEVARMAVERDIPVHIHSGPDPVHLFFELEPDITVIWAHSGLGDPPSVILETMSAHPNLWADTSLREYGIMDGDRINTEWLEILTRFQDRMMVGSDTWVNGQWENYESIMADHRTYLNLLPRDIAEKIAYRNAERLFGVTVTLDLIGKKQ